MANHNPPVNGFDKHPENIRPNIQGRPKKVRSIADALRHIGEQHIPASIRGKLPEHIQSSKSMHDALMKIIWLRALAGEPWAVQFVAERTEGKVADRVQVEGTETMRFEFVVLQPGQLPAAKQALREAEAKEVTAVQAEDGTVVVGEAVPDAD